MISPNHDSSRPYDYPLVEITQSAVSMFLTCRQKYVLRYLMHIKRPGHNVALLIGTAFHTALEMYLAPEVQTKPKTRHKVLPRIKVAIDEVFDKAVNSSDLSTNHEKLEYGRAQAHAVFAAWQIVNDDWSRLRMIATEQSIRAERKIMPHGIVDIGSRLAGKIDGIVMDEDGRLWILEHKTRQSLRSLDFVANLPLDHQALFYAILWEEHISREKSKMPTGKTVPVHLRTPSGFYYDVAVKPLHRIAGEFRNLTERMTHEMVQEPDKYFAFVPVMFEKDMIDRARNNLQRIVAQMDALGPDTVFMATNRCNDYSGCEYQSLCKAGADVTNPEAVLALPQMAGFVFETPHNELEEGGEE